MLSNKRLDQELRGLTINANRMDKPSGLGLERVVAHCRGNAGQVLERVTSVLIVVNQNSRVSWPSDGEWRSLLPVWFVTACAPEESQQQAEAWLSHWRQLTPQQQHEAERNMPWSLSNWIYWFRPDQRRWYWSGAEVVDHNLLVIDVEVIDWPLTSGALTWLLQASGAERVEYDAGL